ncbi:MAG: VOC family protein, partial [Planctomycetota bacterium]
MNDFVWADLSTYDPDKSGRFYERVFGWSFHDSGGYFVAFQGSSEVAGLFETPAFFQKIKMPHFWMSYIAVEDATATAEAAKDFDGAKVELIDDFYGGKVA